MEELNQVAWETEKLSKQFSMLSTATESKNINTTNCTLIFQNDCNILGELLPRSSEFINLRLK